MQIAKKRSAQRVWRKAIPCAALLIVAIEFSGCLAGTSSNGGNPPPPVTGATVSFCDDGEAGCTPATSFSVASLRDLVINVNWENLSAGNHTQTLDILQPGGGLYQSTQTSFLVPDSSKSSLTMTRNLPVAGAWISQRRITGEWSVRVSLDGNAITTQSVQLNP